LLLVFSNKNPFRENQYLRVLLLEKFVIISFKS